MVRSQREQRGSKCEAMREIVSVRSARDLLRRRNRSNNTIILEIRDVSDDNSYGNHFEIDNNIPLLSCLDLESQ